MSSKAKRKLLVEGVEYGKHKWEELNREQKFNVIYDKTRGLQVFLANRLVANLKHFESYTSEDYVSIDDILQECSLLSWKLLKTYDKIPYEDFLRLYKSAIWKAVYLGGISKAKLKKNACLTEPAGSEDETKSINDVVSPAGDFDTLFDRMNMEWVKSSFNSFLHNIPDVNETDKKIFNLIAYPSDGFVDFCFKRNNSKKNNTKAFVNKISIAKYLDISPTGVGMSIKRITDKFQEYRRAQDDNREVQEQEVPIRKETGV